jgi:signal transduction histidine kinase
MEDARDRQWLTLFTPSEIVVERRRLQIDEPPGKASVFIFRDVTREARVSRTKSDFVSAAAHEIRTPLSTVLGFSELLHTGAVSPEETAEFAALIHRHATELTHLLDELLDLSRIEASGMRAFQYRREALRAFIDGLLAGYGNSAQRERISVSDTCAQDLEILADAEKLTQALRNLLHNALKYSPLHSAVDMGLSTFEKGGQTFIQIIVSDRGIGIAESDLARIFLPFARGANAQHLPGTGLGLPLAMDVIRNHDGTISIHSALGQGTTVTVVLPAAAPNAPTLPALSANARQYA